MSTPSLLILPGDGIGPEVMVEVRKVIDWYGANRDLKFDVSEDLVGGAAYDAHGVPLHDDTMAKAQDVDAVLLGAVGGPKYDALDFSVKPERGLLRLRKEMDLFANLRPAQCFDALADFSSLKKEVVAGLDIVIVRELTSGVYFGEPRGLFEEGNERGGSNTQRYTRTTVERAAPARFAARMFDSLSPEIAECLRGYQYDRIYRVSLGYHKRDLPARLEMPPDMAFPFLLATDQPGRVPDEFHQLVQVGVRAAADADPNDIVQAAVRQCGWGEKPMMQQVHYWAEADPLSCYDEGHRANMAAIQNLLPAGVSLIGSDYSQPAPQHKGVARLDDRIRQGQRAARAAIAYRKARKQAHV